MADVPKKARKQKRGRNEHTQQRQHTPVTETDVRAVVAPAAESAGRSSATLVAKAVDTWREVTVHVAEIDASELVHSGASKGLAGRFVQSMQ